MKRSDIEKIAHTPEDRLLLARVWDKIQAGLTRQIPANTCFLSPREQEMARFLFGETPGLSAFGGCPEAERKMLVYSPEYMAEDWLYGEESPVACLEASFYPGDEPTHRDFLGAVMGAGVAREAVGDIYVDKSRCYLFVTGEIAPYIAQNLLSAGRASLKIRAVPLREAALPQPETQEIRDTVASPRLDSIIASGFRVSRSRAAEYIAAGRAAIDGLPCEKPDKPVPQGSKVSVRGLGKLCLRTVGGQTKKGRVVIVIDRYI